MADAFHSSHSICQRNAAQYCYCYIEIFSRFPSINSYLSETALHTDSVKPQPYFLIERSSPVKGQTESPTNWTSNNTPPESVLQARFEEAKPENPFMEITRDRDHQSIGEKQTGTHTPFQVLLSRYHLGVGIPPFLILGILWEQGLAPAFLKSVKNPPIIRCPVHHNSSRRPAIFPFIIHVCYKKISRFDPQ